MEQVQEGHNFDLHNLVAPVNVDVLHNLLVQAGYPSNDTEFLVNGFSRGFDLGYQGPTSRQDTSKNLPIRAGSQVQLWNKIIKEVNLGRYAGPFERIPYKNYIQSPWDWSPKQEVKPD